MALIVYSFFLLFFFFFLSFFLLSFFLSFFLSLFLSFFFLSSFLLSARRKLKIRFLYWLYCTKYTTKLFNLVPVTRFISISTSGFPSNIYSSNAISYNCAKFSAFVYSVTILRLTTEPAIGFGLLSTTIACSGQASFSFTIGW